MKIQKVVEDVPSRVIIEVTQKCNLSCEGCFSKSKIIKKKFLSEDEIFKIGLNCVRNKIPSISWTGGEPYIVKNLLSVLRRIKDYDPSSKVIHTINTNGLLITPKLAKDSSKIFKLARVSLHGNSESYSKWTNSSGKDTLQSSINAIKYFIKYGLPVQVNIPVYSIKDLQGTLKLINNNFKNHPLIEEVVFIPRIIVGSQSGNKDLYPSIKEINSFFMRNKDQLKFKWRIFVWKLGKHFVIKSDGFAYAHPIMGAPEGLVKIGDPRVESIKKIWKKFPKEHIKSHRNLTPDLSHLK